MPSGKHKIPRDKAEKMIKKFIERRGSGKPLPVLPDGYIFDAKEVKELLGNPSAHYFIISLGLLETEDKGKQKEAISPILCVADSNYKILNGSKDGATAVQSASLAVSGEKITNSAEDINDFGDDDGGFLDESKPYPPPYLGL